MITAAQLYDHVSCPRRVDLDLHADVEGRAELSAFVRMLWERGAAPEDDVVRGLPEGTVRLAGLPGDERELLTIQAMDAGADLIHGGRIRADDLLGDPDLLVRRGAGYVAALMPVGRRWRARRVHLPQTFGKASSSAIDDRDGLPQRRS